MKMPTKKKASPKKKSTAKPKAPAAKVVLRFTKFFWNPSTDAEIAESVFKMYQKRGFTTYAVNKADGEVGKPMKKFDPKAGAMLFAAAAD